MPTSLTVRAGVAGVVVCAGLAVAAPDAGSSPSRIAIGVPAAGVIDSGAQADAWPTFAGFRPGVLVWVTDTGTETMTLLGETMDVPTQSVARFACGSDTAGLTPADLKAIFDSHADTVATQDMLVIDSHRPAEGGGLDIVFNASGSLPTGAADALAIAEQYIESNFPGDDTEVSLSISFQSLGSSVLGATNANYLRLPYTTVRQGLVDGIDANDQLPLHLPVNTLPVRYNSASTSVTQEDYVYVTRANVNAAIQLVGGQAASLVYSTNFAWDYDPTNGVSFNRTSFVDVVIHEVTHALGFASGADFRNNDLEMPDLIRFQRTDGTGNYNPDSLADFTTTPRLVDYNSPNDDHNSDLIDVEYRMSDGSPYQASHFREQTQNIGLMDPAIGGGQTYVNRPDTSYYSQADLDVLDFMGYDLPAGEPADPGCSGADLVAPYGVLNFADVQVFLGLFATQDSAVDYAAPQGVFNFADVQVFLGLFSAGCE